MWVTEAKNRLDNVTSGEVIGRTRARNAVEAQLGMIDFGRSGPEVIRRPARRAELR